MKKLSLALLTTTLCAVAATTSVFAADGTIGTITINGRVITSTCTLTGGGIGSGTQNVTVTLPTVLNSAFGTTAGTVVEPTNFTLALTNSAGDKACDATTIAGLKGITLGGNTDQYVTGSPTQLVNTNSDSTVNVQLKLASGSELINFALPNQLTNSNATTTTSGIWNMQAQYISTTASTAAQQVNSVVSYILNYN